MNFQELCNFIWGIADLVRDLFKRGEYQKVILPLLVLRRLDAVLEPTRDAVRARYAWAKENDIPDPDQLLRTAAGHAFYNISPYSFKTLLDDHANLRRNLDVYIDGYSANIRRVIDKFDMEHTLDRLDENNLLYLVMARFQQAEVGPDHVDNFTMGTVFEELIRRFNEALNENPGEHYTPREIIQLMARLMLAGKEDDLRQAGRRVSVYDPCAGSGGMLTITENLIKEMAPGARVDYYGQEVNPDTWAVACSDLLIRSDENGETDHIALGSTLSQDAFAGQVFDYLITNPPYGKDWKGDREAVMAEAARGYAGRFGAGTPAVSDGQMLFLLHLIHHMRPASGGGARACIVMNGSPLFTGSAGGGETEIRRWILENDLLEALVALPEQLFYNTGIATYIWVLNNNKTPERRGLVQLIDARESWVPMRKSLGNKRREFSAENIADILARYTAFEENETVQIHPNAFFGYRRMCIERPLRLRFELNEETLAVLEEQRAWAKLDGAAQAELLQVLHSMTGWPFMDRALFRKQLNARCKPTAAVAKAIEAALGQRDETAAICKAKGQPEADTELRDYENVPLEEDPQAYYEREVLPYAADAWIAQDWTDARDGEPGRVGYEINFNRYFYTYTPPRPLKEIEADIETLQGEIADLLREVEA